MLSRASVRIPRAFNSSAYAFAPCRRTNAPHRPRGRAYASDATPDSSDSCTKAKKGEQDVGGSNGEQGANETVSERGSEDAVLSRAEALPSKAARKPKKRGLGPVAKNVGLAARLDSEIQSLIDDISPAREDNTLPAREEGTEAKLARTTKRRKAALARRSDQEDLTKSITREAYVSRRRRLLAQPQSVKEGPLVDRSPSETTLGSGDSGGSPNEERDGGLLQPSGMGQAVRDSLFAARDQSLKSALLGSIPKGLRSGGKKNATSGNISVLKMTEKEMRVLPLRVDSRPPVPTLAHSLDRVLFNPGVYHLQDPLSRVYNFDPYLQKIMPVTEFNFSSLKEYLTSSRDEFLRKLALENNKKYIGSTSSMTSSLAHFHYLLSQWRPLNLSMLSKGFPETNTNFTLLNRAPSAVFLRWKDGTYAVDADKEFDSANILMMLGKSMEKLLTLPVPEFERYRRSHPNQITKEEQQEPEAFHYSTMGDFLMRSQLDARDSRLPGTGTFDLKTRAVVSIRMETDKYEKGTGYQIKTDLGMWESFEREYYDMLRSTMLKYSLQVRMGRMDGIFVAFHNVERIFGFQYISLVEMDRALHGEQVTGLGNAEFRFSVRLLNIILNRATERFPKQTLRLHFETRQTKVPFMYVFAQPVTDAEADRIQNSNKKKIEEWERRALGLDDDEVEEEEDEEEEDADDGSHREPGEGWQELQAQVKEEMEMDELGEYDREDASSNTEGETKTSGTSPQQAGLEETPEVTNSQASVNGIERLNETPADAQDEEQRDQGASEVLREAEKASKKRKKKTSSAADADVEYEPLLAMTLTIRNKVRGEYVERPENLPLRVRNEWEVEYWLDEIKTPRSAWELYRKCKKRRRQQLEDNDDGDESKAVDHYIRVLREMSERGRIWRQKRDEIEEKEDKVVYRPRWPKRLPAKKEAAHEPEIKSTDDYLCYLFGQKTE